MLRTAALAGIAGLVIAVNWLRFVDPRPEDGRPFLIALLAIGAFSVQIDPVVIHLPDFNDRIADRFSHRTESPSSEVRDLSHSGRDGVVDDQQVIVSVQGERVRIERAFSLPWRSSQFFGKRSANGQRPSTERKAL